MEIFITGIDTDAGKSIVTGLIAKYLIEKSQSVITQKYVQTGCQGIAEDLLVHRRIMGTELFTEDKEGDTCSYLFKHPASPHLSAQMENIVIDADQFTKSTIKLSKKFNYVLMEGAGGLMVPLNTDTLLVDYIQQKGYPCILVSSSKLGSINHTILSLEVLKKRNINVIGLVYNQYPNSDPQITSDSEQMIQKFLQQYFPDAGFVSIPEIKMDKPTESFDFSNIIKL